MAFYADHIGSFPPNAERARVLVVKCHVPSAAMLFLTRLTRGRIFVTVREPRDAIVSLLQRFHHPFESSLKDVAEQAAQIVELSRTHQSMTLRYEDRFFEKNDTIGRIASFLGVRLSAAACRRIQQSLTREAVEKKIGTLRARGRFGKKPDPDKFDPKTQWHPGHVGDGQIGKYAAALSPEQQRRIVASTREYCDQFGYATRIQHTSTLARPKRKKPARRRVSGRPHTA